jgi:hypothetical protein
MALGGIIEAIVGMGELFENLGTLIVTFLKYFTELLPLAIDILKPVKILNDLIAGFFLGIKVVFTAIGDIFTSGPNFKYNKCKDAGSGIFGFRRKRDENGNIIDSLENDGTKKCVKPTFINLMIMVLCPPLALFIHLGLRGWFHILVCAFLTVKTYYFPGLIYTIMHMLC